MSDRYNHLKNPLIRKLAQEAQTKHTGDFGMAVYGDADMEKFAELIVNECCDVFVELRTRPADLAVLDVKKHFGVKDE